MWLCSMISSWIGAPAEVVFPVFICVNYLLYLKIFDRERCNPLCVVWLNLSVLLKVSRLLPSLEVYGVMVAMV